MLVVSVPPLGCVPSMLYKSHGQCANPLNNAIQSYNVALLNAITYLQASNFSNAHILYANAYDLALKILSNPMSFGMYYKYSCVSSYMHTCTHIYIQTMQHNIIHTCSFFIHT